MMGRTKRDAYYDNLKFWLITIVVVGHFVEFYINQNDVCKWLWYYIYIFHMPLFIFVTALFLKTQLIVNLSELIKFFRTLLYVTL